LLFKKNVLSLYRQPAVRHVFIETIKKQTDKEYEVDIDETVCLATTPNVDGLGGKFWISCQSG
jgi:hypothetical protein